MDITPADAAGRLAAFDRLLLRVHEITEESFSETAMLQAVCEAAAAQTPLGLVWCGKPGADSRVAMLAAAGRVRYLQDVVVSVDPEREEGQGLSGQAWRQGTPCYAPLIDAEPGMGHWRGAATRFGLTGVVVIRVNRQGAPWGLFSFYLVDGAQFEPAVRLTLEQLVRTVARGLDRIDSRERERSLAAAQRTLLDHAQAGIALLDETGRIIFANPYLVQVLGYTRATDMAGLLFTRFVSDRSERAQLRRLLMHLTASTVERSSVHLRGASGQTIISDMAFSAASDGRAPVVVWTVRDVTKRVRLEEEIAILAYRDSVTGLANRWAFDVELARRLERTADGGALAVCLLDLDDFKRVNDTWGHGVGDAVLHELGQRFAQDNPEGNVFAARVGGDELVLLVDGLDRENPMPGLERWVAIWHDHLIEKPYAAIPGGGTVELSMGVAIYPTDGLESAELLRLADQALYVVKRHKHDRMRWWQRTGEAAVPPVSDPDTAADPYGAEARTLLSAASAVVQPIAKNWGAAFYALMEQGPRDSRILHTLSQSVRDALARERSAVAQYAMDPDATRGHLRQVAYSFGERLMLVGSPLHWRTRGIAAFQERVTQALDARWINPSDRYRLQRICDGRCRDLLTVLLESGEATHSAYLEFLGQPVPERRSG